MKTAVILPSNREHLVKKWMGRWEPLKDHVELIVIEDNPTKTFELDWGHHYSWSEIDKDLGPNKWIIPRRAAAVRMYGVLKALDMKADIIWHLDDDCLPADDPVNLLNKHIENLTKNRPYIRWSSVDANQAMTRGVPYLDTADNIRPILSHGTWTKNPDYDALHQLAHQYNFAPFVGFIPRHQYFALSGMNYAYVSSYASLFYHAPYGEHVNGKKFPYSRFDDIWMGIIFKKVADHVGLYAYTGLPQVEHDRASDPMKNLQHEAKAMPLNEKFWKYIDEIHLDSTNYTECVKQIADHMVYEPLDDDAYFIDYGHAIKVWVKEVEQRI